MKIETQIQEDHQAKINVEVEADVMEGMKRRAARKIARRVRIPGFRPGKAPYQVILRHVGEGTVLEEALEMLVEDIYPKIIDEADIQPYGPGALENVVSLEPPVLEFVVPLDAEVTLGDYRSLRKPYEPSEVSDDDIEEVLKNLQERQAIIEPVERPVQEGDLVTVRLSARRDQVEEGQDPILIRERSVPVLVHSSEEESEKKTDASNEWPFPGFSKHLVDLSEGDERALNYAFPDDAEIEAFRGVNAEFHFTVETVKARNLPPLDDDFASSLGDYEDLNGLISVIRTNLETQAERSYNESYDNEIIEAAIEQTAYKYPPQMLENEVDNVIQDLTRRLEQQGLDLDLYLKTRDLDMDGLREEVKPAAESRLKRALFLYEIAQAEDIEIEAEELEAEATSTVDYLSQVLPEKEARRLSDKNVYSNLVGNIMVDLLSRKAMDRVRAICKGELDEQAEVQAEVGVVNEVEQVDEQAPDSTSEAVETVSAVDVGSDADVENTPLSPLEEETQSQKDGDAEAK